MRETGDVEVGPLSRKDPWGVGDLRGQLETSTSGGEAASPAQSRLGSE